MGKLMKYELRSLWRIFIPCWAAIILLGFINRIFLEVNSEGTLIKILIGLSITTHILAMIAIFIVATVFMISRFYNGLLKESGYLMFTLPSSTSSLIWSKAIPAVIISLMTMVFCLSSVGIMLGGKVAEFLSAQWQLWINSLHASESALLLGNGIAYLIAIVVSLFSQVFRCYLAMAIGQLANKRKVGLAVLSYLGITLAESTLINTSVVVINILSINNRIVMGESLRYWADKLNTAEGILTLILICMIVGILLASIQMLLYYFITHGLLKKKLNLE